MEVIKKELAFPQEIKDQFEKYLSRKNIEITYVNGLMIEFSKSNFCSISPYKIVMQSDNIGLVILYYGEYHQSEGLYFVNDADHPCTFPKLRELVAKMF